MGDNSNLMDDFNLESAISGQPDVPHAEAKGNDILNSLGKSFLDTTSVATQQQNTLLQQSTAAVQKQIETINTNRKSITVAKDHQASLAKTPRIIKNVLGMFDTDFNEQYWNKQVEASANEIDNAQTNIQNLSVLTQNASSMIENKLKQTQLIYGIQQGRIQNAIQVQKDIEAQRQNRFAEALALKSDQRSQTELQMQVTQFKQQQQARDLTAMPDNQLAQIVANPNGAGNYSQQQAKEEQMRRQGLTLDQRSKELSLTLAQSQEERAKAADARSKISFANEQTTYGQQQILYRLATSSDEELGQAVSNKDGAFGFTQYQAKEEQLRRQQASLQIKSIQNAVDAGDLENAAKKTDYFLSTQNLGTLGTLRKEAITNGGSVDFHGLTLTTRQIESGISSAVGEQTAQAKAQADTEEALSTVDAVVANTATTIINASSAFGSATPIKPLEDAHNIMVAKLQARVKAGDFVGAQAIAEKGYADVTTAVQKLVDRYPEAQRPMLNDQLQGLPIRPDDASAYLGATVLNKDAMKDGRFSAAWQLVQNKAKGMLVQQGIDINNMSPQQLTAAVLSQNTGGKKLDMNQVIQSAFSDSGASQAWEGQRNVTAWNFALQDLAQKMPAVFGGMSTNSFMQQNGQGQVQFNSDLLLQALYNRYQTDLASGKASGSGADTPGGQMSPIPYDQVMLEYMGSSTFQQSQSDFWTAGMSPDATAFSTLLFSNAPMDGFTVYLQGVQGSFEDYKHRLNSDKQLQGNNYSGLMKARSLAGGN